MFLREDTEVSMGAVAVVSLLVVVHEVDIANKAIRARVLRTGFISLHYLAPVAPSHQVDSRDGAGRQLFVCRALGIGFDCGTADAGSGFAT